MSLDNEWFTIAIEAKKNGWTGLTQEEWNEHVLWVANLYARAADPNHKDVKL